MHGDAINVLEDLSGKGPGSCWVTCMSGERGTFAGY